MLIYKGYITYNRRFCL